MKKTILLSTILLSGIILFSAFVNNNSCAKKEGIVFHEGTWKQALTKAKEEKKLIFLDANASWCGPCKKMERRTFTDPVVAKFYNTNFINVKMDMEKGEGIALSQKLQLRAYPTLYFINGKGEVVDQQTGYMNATDLLAYGKIVKKME